MVLPSFIIMHLVKNRHNLDDVNFLERWGALYKEFRADSKYEFLYYCMFFVRRFIISFSLILFKDFTYAQILICSTSCWAVRYIQIFFYVILRKPYKSRLINYFCIFIELATSISYSLTLFFIEGIDLNPNTISWIIIICIKASYLAYLLVTVFSAIRAIVDKIRVYRNRRLSAIQIQTTLNIQ